MRAALVELWPLLSQFYGIHPWDTPRMSLEELGQYVEDLPEARARAATNLRLT